MLAVVDVPSSIIDLHYGRTWSSSSLAVKTNMVRRQTCNGRIMMNRMPLVRLPSECRPRHHSRAPSSVLFIVALRVAITRANLAA